MAYNPNNDATAGYIGKEYKEMLNKLATAHGRKLRAELETIIKQAAKKVVDK